MSRSFVGTSPEPPRMASTGELIRAHRRRLGWTQEELAERSGVSGRSIGKLESGRIASPRPSTLRLLADALGLSDVDRERLVAGPIPERRTSPQAVVPAQLPPDIAGFTGRKRHLHALDALLGREDGIDPATMLITLITGTAGVGKTALALHWAHQVAADFPDGQLYVNLRGFDAGGTVVGPADALRGFLLALDTPPERIPSDLEGRTALYRSRLAGRRVLVVLDNANDAEQVRPLLPGAAGCAAVVTSRNQLPSLVAGEAAHPIALDLLSSAESREVLVRRLGADRVAAEPAAVDELISRCAGLPLALVIVAARAAIRPEFPLAAIAAQLGREALDSFRLDDAGLDVRTVFSWSYRRLSAPAARLFRLIGLHAGPDIGLPAAASVGGLPTRETEALLDELTRAHLLTEHVLRRYTMHDLLRVYAAERAREVDDPDERVAALRRLADHYVWTGHDGAVLLYPHRDRIVLDPPAPDVRPEAFDDAAGALAWFSAEHHVLLSVIRYTADVGLHRSTWQLAWTLETYAHRQGHWDDLAMVQRLALRGAERCGDQPAQAYLLRGLARTYGWLGLRDEARSSFDRAFALYVALGDEDAQARVHHGLTELYDRDGDHTVALSHAEQALRLYQSAGNRAGEARARNALGWCETMLGNHQRAVRQCREALALFEEIGDRSGCAETWDSLGFAHHRLGEHREAARCFERSVALCRDIGDSYHEAEVLVRLGDALERDGAREPARAAWHRALDILTQLEHPGAEQVLRRLA